MISRRQRRRKQEGMHLTHAAAHYAGHAQLVGKRRHAYVLRCDRVSSMSSGPQRRRRSVERPVVRGLVFLLAVCIGLLATISEHAGAHSYKLGDIAIGHIWAPPPGDGAEGLAVFGPILNQGSATVQLVGASAPIAGQVRFRKLSDGAATWVDVIELRPGKPLALAPWREHIWLSGLNRPLKEGDSFDLTLDFGDAGRLQVKVVVEKASGH